MVVDEQAVGQRHESREVGVFVQQREVLRSSVEGSFRTLGNERSHRRVVTEHHVVAIADLRDCPHLAAANSMNLRRRERFPMDAVRALAEAETSALLLPV